MKNQILTILFISMGLALVASFYNGCKKEKDNNTLSGKVETLQAKNIELTDNIREQKVKVDTLYRNREVVKMKYGTVIKHIHTLDSSQQDSLFGLIYPSKDSANATYYHYLSASEQLAITYSIVMHKDTIIASQDTIISNQSKIIAVKDSKIKSEVKAKNAWKIATIAALLLNLLH